MLRIAIVALMLTVGSMGASARIFVGDPSDFRTLLDNLVAGDSLYLEPGNYTLSLRIIDIVGTESQPILIGGQSGQAKPVFLGNSCCNTVSSTPDPLTSNTTKKKRYC